MADITTDQATAKPATMRINNTVIDLFPIRLRDWVEASRYLYLLDFDSLSDIAYIGALDNLKALIEIAARSTELQKTDNLQVLEEMTNNDYVWLRQNLMAQNNINLDRVRAKLEKISARKDSKNA